MTVLPLLLSLSAVALVAIWFLAEDSKIRAYERGICKAVSSAFLKGQAGTLAMEADAETFLQAMVGRFQTVFLNLSEGRGPKRPVSEEIEILEKAFRRYGDACVSEHFDPTKAD